MVKAKGRFMCEQLFLYSSREALPRRARRESRGEGDPESGGGVGAGGRGGVGVGRWGGLEALSGQGEHGEGADGDHVVSPPHLSSVSMIDAASLPASPEDHLRTSEAVGISPMSDVCAIAHRQQLKMETKLQHLSQQFPLNPLHPLCRGLSRQK
eukprot:4463150-Pleurochrysis_carterae.AAC.3